MIMRTRKTIVVEDEERSREWRRKRISLRENVWWPWFGVILIMFALIRQWFNYGWWYVIWLGKNPKNERRVCVIQSHTPNLQRHKIGILSLVPSVKEVTLSRFAGLAAMNEEAIQNKRQYAKRHDYDLHLVEAETTLERPAPWSKLKRLAQVLPSYDWLLYLDGDALVANADLDLELCGYIDDRYDIIMAQDWGGYNTGVFLIKNSNFSLSFLHQMYDAATTYNLARKEPWYNHAMPFEYEQRALHFFTRSKTWTKKGQKIPQYYDKADAKNIRSHIKVLPQCAINSYLVRPRFHYDTKHSNAQFAQGDFIVHLAGHKANNKAILFRYALDHIAAQSQSSISKQTSTCGNLVSLPNLKPINPALLEKETQPRGRHKRHLSHHLLHSPHNFLNSSSSPQLRKAKKRKEKKRNTNPIPS